MKSYPKIEYHNKGLFGKHCIAFDKLDGSNLRFEWGHKRGWYKFGTRTTMIDRSSEQFGKGIDIFLNKYGEDLDRIFRTKYRKVESFVVFAEFLGENSFAGQHLENEEKDVILFDVNQYKRGFINPNEFILNFGHLHIPNIVYDGKYTNELISTIRNADLKEGVIIKGEMKSKNGSDEVWMVKIKTNEWLQKIKEKFGEKYLLEELNNDKNLFYETIN